MVQRHRDNIQRGLRHWWGSSSSSASQMQFVLATVTAHRLSSNGADQSRVYLTNTKSPKVNTSSLYWGHWAVADMLTLFSYQRWVTAAVKEGGSGSLWADWYDPRHWALCAGWLVTVSKSTAPLCLWDLTWEGLAQGWANILIRGPQWLLNFDRGAGPGANGWK